MEFTKENRYLTIDASSIDISGTERIRISDTGIDICNNYTISFEELAFLDGVTENIQNQFNSGIWKQKTGASNDIYLNNNARANATSGVSALGFVGIGTDNPLAKLHVTAGIDSGAMLFQPNNSATAGGGRIFFKESSADMSLGFSIGYNGGEGDFSLNWPDNTFCFSGHNDNELGENHMTIQRDNGYVGLGVPHPQSRLHLDGDITMSGSIDMSGLIAFGGANPQDISKTSLDISGSMAILPSVEGHGLHLGKVGVVPHTYWNMANTVDNINATDGLYFNKVENGLPVLDTMNMLVLKNTGTIGIGIAMDNMTSKVHIYQNSNTVTDSVITLESPNAAKFIDFKDTSTTNYGFIKKIIKYDDPNLGTVYGVENSTHKISFQVATNVENNTVVPNYPMRIGYNDINMTKNLLIGAGAAGNYPLEISKSAYIEATVAHNDPNGTIPIAAYRYVDFKGSTTYNIPSGGTDFSFNVSTNPDIFKQAPISIKAKGSIWLYGANSTDEENGTANVGLYISSDERIKTDIEDVPDNLALEMINNIETKYYRYKDPKSYVQQKTIGFIAQNVREHIPSAVSIQPNIIPDELRLIDNPQWTQDISSIKWRLTIPDLDMSSNNTGKCVFYAYEDISGTEKLIELQVEPDTKSFIFDEKWNHVYFYGKEVNDFHTIRKEVIFTVHHSAIQELSKIVVKHANEIVALKQENIEMRARLDSIEASIGPT